MSANKQIKTERRRQCEAAIWHTRLQRGRLTPYERAKYQAWSADPENVRALSEAQRIWDAMGEAMASRSPAVSAPAPRARKYGTVWRVAAALAVLAPLGWIVYSQLDRPGSQAQVLQTQAEPLYHRALPDGTMVSLKPHTRLRFEMSDEQRLARLPRGEIFFDVAPERQRPFVVEVGDGSIRALGTRFAVRQYDGPALVVVEEGVVAVKRGAGDEPTRVTAGQQLEIVRTGKLIVRAVDARKALEWARLLMSFQGKTVAQIAEEFNRRNRLQIEIEDAQVANEVVGLGIFYLDDPENFVGFLTAQGKVIVDRTDPAVLRLSRGPGNGAGG